MFPIESGNNFSDLRMRAMHTGKTRLGQRVAQCLGQQVRINVNPEILTRSQSGVDSAVRDSGQYDQNVESMEYVNV
jgi:hypothetical protein